MPVLNRLIATIALALIASVVLAQPPDTPRVDTVHDTIHDTTYLADTTDRYYQLAKESVEFKKSAIDSLQTITLFWIR